MTESDKKLLQNEILDKVKEDLKNTYVLIRRDVMKAYLIKSSLLSVLIAAVFILLGVQGYKELGKKIGSAADNAVKEWSKNEVNQKKFEDVLNRVNAKAVLVDADAKKADESTAHLRKMDDEWKSNNLPSKVDGVANHVESHTVQIELLRNAVYFAYSHGYNNFANPKNSESEKVTKWLGEISDASQKDAIKKISHEFK